MSEQNEEVVSDQQESSDGSTNQETSLEKKFYGENEDESNQEKKDDKSTSQEQESDSTKDKNQDEKKEGSEESDQKKDSEDDFSLSRSEGSHLVQEHIDKIAEFAKERGLSKEVAQELVVQQEELLQGIFDQAQKQQEKMIDDWAVECENHPTHGGKKFEENQKFARIAVEKFVPKQMREEMVKNGLADNPDYFVVFSNIGRAMADDSFDGLQNPKAQPKLTMADKFYGGSNKN